MVIPARWGSQRLPGKPLMPIAGVPLLARVIDLVRRSTRSGPPVDLVVATDDHRIAALAAARECPVAMTDPGLSSGSARALAAALQRPVPPVQVLNMQGDAPFMPEAAVAGVLAALRAGARIATPAVRLRWDDLDALRAHKVAAPFSGTTVTIGTGGIARWFSKQVIPAIRDEARWRAETSCSPVHQHLGLYGYALDALIAFERMPPSQLEQLEGLEQLRFFELGEPIQVVTTSPVDMMMGGIDTPADIARAERLIASFGDPYRR